MRIITAAFAAIMLVIGGAVAAAAGSPGATVAAFAPDLLGGDDGLPSSPDLPPLRYGPIDTPVDVDGNALDAHEGQYIAFFNGQYYLYGTSYGCGTHIDLSDNTPFCGFASYRSPDLVHWRLASRFLTDRLRQVCSTYCAFPKVVFNPHRRRYQMYFSSDNGGNLGSDIPSSRWLAESTSPAGPWSGLREPALEFGASDAYGLAGQYMFEMHHTPNSVYTEVWAEHLDADGTGTLGAPTLVGTGLYANVSAFRHGGHWYLTLATNARFYGPAALVYLRADRPTGPWSAPVAVSADSCGGTAQSVSVLPDGTPVEMIDLYRSSPADASPALPVRERHGDWNQAIAGRYWAPLHFTADGAISPIECTATTALPLQHGVVGPALPSRQDAAEAGSPLRNGAGEAGLPLRPGAVEAALPSRQDAGEAGLPLRDGAGEAGLPLRDGAGEAGLPLWHGAVEMPHQADCRVSAHGIIEQDWTGSPRTVRISVFQRATVTDPSFPAKIHEPTAVNAPLIIELITGDGTRRWTVPATDVSWAPRAIAVPVSGHGRLRLRTAATNGCYGVLVHPTRTGRYAAIVNGVTRPAPGAGMI